MFFSFIGAGAAITVWKVGAVFGIRYGIVSGILSAIGFLLLEICMAPKEP